MTFRRVSGACGFVLLFSGLVAGTRAPHTIHLKSGVLELDDRYPSVKGAHHLAVYGRGRTL